MNRSDLSYELGAAHKELAQARRDTDNPIMSEAIQHAEDRVRSVELLIKYYDEEPLTADTARKSKKKYSH